MDSKEAVYRRIPHRPPFLWVDRIVSLSKGEIETETFIPPELELFAGHYPHHPIFPGVLLCECVFQAGALLIAESLASGGEKADPAGIPVLTRIQGARFKRQVGPGDSIRVRVRLLETVGNAWFLKGKALLEDKTAMTVEFACTVAGNSRPDEEGGTDAEEKDC